MRQVPGTSTDISYKVVKHPASLYGMQYFRMELDCIKVFSPGFHLSLPDSQQYVLPPEIPVPAWKYNQNDSSSRW